MTRAIPTRLHGGLFSSSVCLQKQGIRQQQLTPPPSPRQLNLDKAKSFLELNRGTKDPAELLGKLQENIMHFAWNSFVPFKKSVIFAVYFGDSDTTMLTIPQESPPDSCYISYFCSSGTQVNFPFQPEIIREAIETRMIASARIESGEEFVAVPLVEISIHNPLPNVIGVLLFSNRIDETKAEFSDEDINFARSIGEEASKALWQLLAEQREAEGASQADQLRKKQLLS